MKQQQSSQTTKKEKDSLNIQLDSTADDTEKNVDLVNARHVVEDKRQQKDHNNEQEDQEYKSLLEGADDLDLIEATS